MARRAHRWRAGATVLAAAGLLVPGLRAPAVSAADKPRTDLDVLVVDNGDSPVEAVAAQLKSEGVPYTTVNPNDSGRTIDAAFLGDTVDGTPRAKFRGARRLWSKRP